MTLLYACEICGDPYIGDEAPTNCPFCGAHKKFMKPFSEAKINFDVELNEKDKANAETALMVEVSNAAFYFDAAKKVESSEGKKLFKALGRVEAEHASIWKKILKLDTVPKADDKAIVEYKVDLQDSHDREDRAISFYRKAAEESENSRVKEIFEALVVVETDHLELSEKRLG